jgi:hypothetical protein
MSGKKTKSTPKKKPAAKPKPKPKAKSPIPVKGFDSPSWERVYLLSLELELIARELGQLSGQHDDEGFDLVDASRELARLASNHNRDNNPAGRTAEQENEDWITVAGLGADLGNMSEESGSSAAMHSVRTIAHEVCYLACDYLF